MEHGTTVAVEDEGPQDAVDGAPARSATVGWGWSGGATGENAVYGCRRTLGTTVAVEDDGAAV